MNNEPAFGGYYQDEPEITLRSSGLTKREWFAGMALMGIIGSGITPKVAAKAALEYADAIIKESAE